MKRGNFIMHMLLILGFASLWKVGTTQIGPFSKVKKIPYRLLRTYSPDCEFTPALTQKKSNEYWIAYSDSENNTTFADPFGRKAYSSLDFMEPVFVIKQKNGYCKLVAYDRSIIKRGKGMMSGLRTSDEGQRLTEHKKAIYKGWIREDYLIHSPEPMVCGNSTAPVKYYVAIYHPKALMRKKNFLEQDSIPLTHEPGFRKQSRSQIPLHDWVYVYKTNESPRQYLIGTSPLLDPDSLEGTFGWVSDSAVIPMPINGVLVCNDSSLPEIGGPLPISGKWLSAKNSRYGSDSSVIDLREHSLIEEGRGILPIHAPLHSAFRLPDREIKTHVPMEMVDLRNSKVFNCVGMPLSFPTYESLSKSLKNVNIVLVFEDGEEGKTALLNMVSSFPSIYQKTRGPGLEGFNFKWGAAGYFARGISDTLTLTKDFSKFLNFVQSQAENAVYKDRLYEHVMLRGLLEACRILKGHENEHNIVLVVGSKVDPNIYDKLANRIVPKFSRLGTSLVFVQSHLDKADHYGDFILQAKQISAQVGKGVTNSRKKFIVDNRYLRSKNKFIPYDRCGSGYLYDFPENSMQKGGIFFPAMEEQICPDILRSVMDSLLSQIQEDSKRILNDLITNFRTVGRFEQQINPLLKKILLEQGHRNVPDSVANSINAPFYTEVYVRTDVDSTGMSPFEPSILIEESEFIFLTKKLRRVVLDPRLDRKGNPEFDYKDRKRWYNELKRICKDHQPFVQSKGNIDETTVADVIYMASGYPVRNEAFHNWSLKMIGRKTGVEMEELGLELIAYYESLKHFEQLPATPKIKVLVKGEQTYYTIPFRSLP